MIQSVNFGAKPTGLKAYSTTSIWTTSGNLLFLSLNLSFFLYKQGQQHVNLLGLLKDPMINKQKALKSGLAHNAPNVTTTAIKSGCFVGIDTYL